MSDLSDLSDHIDEQAVKSQQTVNDGVSVSRRSLSELDDHYDRKAARAQAAARRPPFYAFVQSPPGATNE